MQNAVIYARYSSHGQNEQTIEGQIRVCREYAQQHKINVVRVYTDKHKTGTDVNRPQFQKMIADSATGAFDCVIVYMIDRFARNRYYSTMYNFQLMQNGVKLLSATENISESEEGEFYQMFLEWNAERYSKRLSKRVREGLTTSVNNGTYTGGHLIYGYKKDGKRVVIDEDAAAVVRYIFAEYVKGVSKADIAAALNAQGLRFRGKPFLGRSFDKILPNAKYTGRFMFGGRLCEDTYPPIIEQAVFDAAQERAQSNKYFSGANSARITYLLQGKLYCGHCGASMVADGGTGKLGVKYHYYACTNRKKKHACNKLNEKKDFIEWYVCEQTVAYLSDPRRVRVIADDVIKYYESRTSQSEIKRVTAERSRVQKEIDNAVNLMVSGVDAAVVKVLNDKIVELSTLLDDLTEQQSKLELEAGLKITRDDIVAFVAEYVKGDPHDPEFQKRIIDNLVRAIYLYDDKIVIYFNVSGGKEMSYIGKDDTDAAIDGLLDNSPESGTKSRHGANTGVCGGVSKGSNFNTLAPPPKQNSSKCAYRFVLDYFFVKIYATAGGTRQNHI